MSSNSQEPSPAEMGAIEALALSLIDLGTGIAKNIEEKLEPIDSLISFNQQLNDHRLAIQDWFKLDNDGLRKKDFYNKVFKQVADKMLGERLLSKPTYLPQILRFFRNVLVNYFPYDVQDESLAEVVHSIFNLEASLYTQALTSSSQKRSPNDPGDGCQTLEQQRIQSEMGWRQSLEPGSRVDAIKQKQGTPYRVNCWARGRIVRYINDDPDNFLIQFDNEGQQTSSVLNRYGPQIAPEGTYTDDIDWRHEIQLGDMFDCQDSENIWYQSTALDFRQNVVGQDEVIQEVYVGYRIYDDEGSKNDDDGRKYIGWSNRYDEWKSVNCATIQRLKTMVKHYKQAGRNYMIYDQMIDDLNDVIHNTHQRKIWTVYRANFFANLRCIADYLNEFGQRGGFDRILEFFTVLEDEKRVTLLHLKYLIDFLSKSMPLWHRQFACHYIPKIAQVFAKKLLYTNDKGNGPLQQMFQKDSLLAVQRSYQNVLKRHFTVESYQNLMSELQFQVGFSLLNSDKLDKRIQGLKEIIEQIKCANNHMRRTLSTDEIIQKLKEEHFFAKIFGENYHIQLIQRSAEVVKLLIRERQFGEDEINHMWSATLRDEQTKLEIYKIIQETAFNYKQEEIELWIDKFLTVPPEQLNEKEIDCVSELTKFNYKKTSFSEKVANLLWAVATRQKKFNRLIIEPSIDKFFEVIRNWDREQKGEYLLSCIENIKEHRAQIPSIKIAMKIIDSIPNYKQSNQLTQFEFINYLITDMGILDILIDDLTHYQRIAQELFRKGVFTNETVEQIELLDMPFNHRHNVHHRINFLLQFLLHSSEKLKQEHLNTLWRLLVVETSISIDKDMFFHWLRTLLGDPSKISAENMLQFFKEKLSNQDNNFKDLKKNGFECIQEMFLLINEQQEKLIINNAGQMGSSVPSMSQQNRNIPANKVEFKIYVPPSQLDGMDILWKLLEEVDKKNQDLIAHIMHLISRVHQNLSFIIEDKMYEIGEQFANECLSRLVHYANSEEKSSAEDLSFVKNMVMMMSSFLRDLEKNGTAQLKTHMVMDHHEYLERIVVQNQVSHLKSCPRYIEFNVYGSLTFWEFKKIVSQKLQISPLKLQLSRADTKKKNLTDDDHIKPLSELALEPGELITASRKPVIFQPKVNLINKKKQLVPEARFIFESWFNTFSVEGIMTPENCVEFIRNSTNDPNVTVNDNRIDVLFQNHNKAQDGRLTREEFLEFYRDSAVMKQEVVWQNLKIHSYGNDLKPENMKLTDFNDPNELKDKSLLIRYKLSDDNYFNLLMDLVDKGLFEVWGFIKILRVNPRMFAELLSLKGVDQIFDFQKQNRFYYALTIMNYFMKQYMIRKPDQIKSYFQGEQDYPSLATDSSAPQSGVSRNNQGPEMTGHSNIPPPPQPFIGPLPPPSANQPQGKMIEYLDTFQGQVIEEDIGGELFEVCDLFEFLDFDEIQEVNLDQLKHDWLPNFIKTNGHQLLIQALDQTFQKLKEEQTHQKVRKMSIKLMLSILRAIFLSSLCGNNNNQDLSTSLQRRVSQVSDHQEEPKQIDSSPSKNENKNENKSAEQKNKLQEEQDEIMKLYQPLIALLHGELGMNILSSVDFQSFQQLLLKIIVFCLDKEKDINIDDRAILDISVLLWNICLAFNPELLEDLYANKIDVPKDGNKDKAQPQTLVLFLIQKGLIGLNFMVRSQFKEALLFVCQQVQNPSLSISPLNFFLQLLIENLHITNTRSKDAKQYFELLKALLEVYFQNKRSNPGSEMGGSIFDSKKMLSYLIEKLSSYQSTERKNSVFQDYTLSGIIEIINMFIVNSTEQERLGEEEYSSLIKEVLEKLLFTFQMEPHDSHILKSTDLAKIEKPNLNKCQSIDSRNAAYDLLLTLIRMVPGNVGQIINEYWYPMLWKVKKPKRSGYAPRSEGRSFHGYCGIKNLGCICYMNSMIQQFFHIPSFRYSILASDIPLEENPKDFEGDIVNDNVMYQFLKFMGFLELSERQEYNPREFCFSLKDFDGLPTNVRIQQDAQEFLNVVFDKIDSQLANTTNKYLLQNIFGGKTCSMMICKSCGNMRQRFEDFYNLSVEVKNQKTLHDGLKKFITGELINDFHCDACDQRVDVQKKTVVDKLPNVLIVHLQRIVFDFDSLQNQKLNSRVEFPNVLNMKQYMLSEVLKEEKETMKNIRKQQKKEQRKAQREAQMQQNAEDHKEEEEGGAQMQQQEDNQDSDFEEEEQEDQQMQEEDERADEDFQYKLVGVVVHMGTADAGHYVSYINVSRRDKKEEGDDWLKTENDKWLEFNDSAVKTYKFADMEEDCFGGIVQSDQMIMTDFKNDYSKNAYMLIYEKRKKQEIKFVLSEDLVQKREELTETLQNLDLDGTAKSKESQNDVAIQDASFVPPHVLYVCPQIKNNLIQNQGILYDEEKKEHYVLAEFNNIQRFVPNYIYKNVHLDNLAFLYEAHIFNNSFFTCTKTMLEFILINQPELFMIEDYSSKLFQFIERLLFDLVVMSNDNKQLNPLTQILISMLRQNDNYLFQFVRNRILCRNEGEQQEKKEKKGPLQENHFFEILIANSDKEVREMAQHLITYAVNRLFELDQKELIDEVMDFAFSMFPEELGKNWLKMQQFLQFLNNVTASGAKQIHYMVEKRLITKLIDFFLETDSPHYSVRNKRPSMGSNYANPPFEPLIQTICYIVFHQPLIVLETEENHEDYKQKVLEKVQQFNYNSPFFLYSPGVDCTIYLHKEDLEMLQVKQFFVKIFNFAFMNLATGTLIAHLCFENRDFSIKMGKIILIGCNKCNADEIRPYLEALEPYLFISDSIRECRYEWILGVPEVKVNHQMHIQSFGPQSVKQCQYKAGLQLENMLTQEIYDYNSTLFKNPSSVKESLLQILYQYRNRWTMYTLLCLISLFKVATNDPERKIMQYLKLMDPPTYDYARYIDWIRPYLEETIQSAIRSQHLHSSKMELQMALNLLPLLNLLYSPNPISNQAPAEAQINENEEQKEEQKQEDKPQQEEAKQDPKQDNIQMNENNQEAQQQPIQEENKEPDVKVIPFNENDGGPHPWIIWSVQEERVLDEKEFPEEQLAVQIIELIVLMSESRPTGKDNLVLKQCNFQFGRGIRQHHQNTGWVVKSQGRGGQRGRKQNQKGKRHKRYVVQNEEEQRVNYDFAASQRDRQGDGYDQDEEQEVPQQQDANGQWVDNLIQKANEQDSTMAVDEVGDTGGVKDEEEIQEEIVGFDVQQQDFNQNEGWDTNNQNQQEGNDSEEDDDQMKGIVPSIEKQESEFWQVSNAGILLFRVFNRHQFNTQKVNLFIKDLSDEGEKLNIRLPKSELRAQIHSQRNRIVGAFTKLRPFDSWGKLDVGVKLVEKKPLNLQLNPPAALPLPYQVENEPQTSGMVDTIPEAGMINCPVCTFLNSTYLSQCEMCQSPLK